MFWHKNRRFARLHQAILATTIGASTLAAHAMTLEPVLVQSEQHEPLAATIKVSNIDANSFSAAIASNAVYQQMGLNSNARIQVQFVKTSDTTGKLLLSSLDPISTPFADVILTLNDQGREHIEPQTLLMPLTNSLKKKEKASPMAENVQHAPTASALVSGGNQQNLPVTTIVMDDSLLNPIEVEPLDGDSLAMQSSDTDSNQNNNDQVNADDGFILEEKERVLAAITPEGTNVQLNILTEQITRRIYPVGEAPNSLEPNTFASSSAEEAIITKTKPLAEESLTKEKEPAPDLQATKPLPIDNSRVSTDSNTQTRTDAVYIVQHGDTLWKIANQIAKANDLPLEKVMHELHQQNLKAFNDGNINQLHANASLDLSHYEIIPSQKAIEEAIFTRKNSANKALQASTNKATQQKINAPQTITQPLPKPQVTLVTPSQSGQAAGSETNNPAISNDSLVATLKSVRMQAAQKAKQVSGLNQDLSSATQKLQLQNQKLAELEARLKALKNQ